MIWLLALHLANKSHNATIIFVGRNRWYMPWGKNKGETAQSQKRKRSALCMEECGLPPYYKKTCKGEGKTTYTMVRNTAAERKASTLGREGKKIKTRAVMTRSRYFIEISGLVQKSSKVTKAECHAVIMAILKWLIFSSTSYKPRGWRSQLAQEEGISPTKSSPD